MADARSTEIERLRGILARVHEQLRALEGACEPAPASEPPDATLTLFDLSASDVLDALPHQVAMLDQQGVIRFVNRAWLAASDTPDSPPDLWAGTSYLDVCDRASGPLGVEAAVVAALIRSVLRGERCEDSPSYPCHTPMEDRWFRVQVAPLGPDTVPVGVLVMHLEVTAEKLAQDALRASESRMATLLDSEPECVTQVSLDGRLLYINPAGLRILEATDASEVLGTPFVRFVHHDDQDAFQTLHDLVVGGAPGELEFRSVGTRGRERWMHTHAVPLSSDTDCIDSVLSVTRDVTERRNTLEAIGALQRRTSSILSSISEGILVIDQSGTTIYENPAAVRALAPNCQATSRLSEGTPLGADDSVNPILHTLRDGAARRVDGALFFKADGASFPVEYACSPLTDEAGRLEGVVVSFRDVTERDDASRALRERDALLSSAQRLASMGTWAYDIASDRLTWSPEMCALFGVVEDGFAGTFDAFYQMIVPDDRGQIDAVRAAALTSEEGHFELEYRVIRPDGQLRRMYERGQVELDIDGVAVRRLGVVMDVTRRHEADQALRARDQLFRRVFADAATGIAITAPDGRYIDANPSYVRMTGYSVAELRAMDFADLIHVDDRDNSETLLHELLHGERDRVVAELRCVTKSGEVVWARLSVAFVRESRGTPLHLVAVVEDINDEKRASDALARAAALLRMASRIGKLGGWSVSLPDRSFTWSSESQAIHGEDTTTRPTLDDVIAFALPEHRPVFRAAFEDCAREGTPFDLELEIATPSGRRLWVRAMGEAYLEEEGRVAAVQGALQDISDRKEADRSLLQSELRFRQQADTMPIIVWTATPDGVFDYANAAFSRLTGVPDDDLLGHGWVSVLHDDDVEPCHAAWSRALLDDIPFATEVRIKSTADASGLWHVVHATPIHDATGSIVRWIGTAIDVHAARSAEREATRLAADLASTLESITDAFFTLDADARFAYVNEEAARLAGLTPSALRGMSMRDVLPATIGAALEHAITAGSRGGGPSELAGVHDHTGAWLVGRTYPAPAGLAVYLRDETENRRARDALHLSEERFRLLCRATNDAVWDRDFVNQTVWWNEGFEALFGYPRREVEHTEVSWTSRVHPDDYPRVVPAMERTIASGDGQWTEEYRFRRSDGTYAYVLDRGQVIRDEQGRPVRMIGGMTDITERWRAEERLAEQAELIEKARDAIVVRDLECRVQYLNRQAELLYGWERAVSVGADVRTLQFARDVAAFERANAAVIRDGEWSGELEQTRRDGTTVLVEGRWTLLRRADGAPYAILAINTDVSEKRRLEQQVLRAQRLESVGTLAGGVAHDLNNILTPILFSIDFLREGLLDPGKLEDIANIETCAKRGRDMVTQLVSFARGYEGRRAAVMMDEMVREVAHILRDTFPKNIALRVASPSGLWPVLGDPTQLSQVLMNLCVNARDAMASGGALSITLKNEMVDDVYAGMYPGSKPGSHVMVEVQDDGSGMRSEVVERIFEPFFTTKELGKGTGLGLSTTYAIVKSHGGFIVVYSELGRGTKFRVYLPADESLSKSKRDFSVPIHLPRGHGEMVLLVDDEEAIRVVVRRILERYGYRVITASNGAEALEIYAKQSSEIDVVLTDMAMPVMDGVGLVAGLMELDPGALIIASSGLQTDARFATVAAGIRSFVAKPYTAELMLGTLRLVLDSGNGPGGT